MKDLSLSRVALCILVCLIGASAVPAQDDRATAIGVVNSLFAAMRERSFEGIKSVFSPDGQLVAIDKPRDGKGISKTRVLTGEAFATMISSSKGPEYIEKMPALDVKVYGDLAVVSGRYTFHLDEKLSHCGTNTFSLVRTEAGWKIANGASTLEFQCDRDLQSVVIETIAADPKDVSTIDGIIAAFYGNVSGSKGVPRQWARDRTLYMPGVNFVSMGEEAGKVRAARLSHQQFADSANAGMVSNGFTEREVGRTVQRFGNIAHVFSTYEYFNDDKTEKGRGINSIELYWNGTRWWIAFAA